MKYVQSRVFLLERQYLEWSASGMWKGVRRWVGSERNILIFNKSVWFCPKVKGKGECLASQFGQLPRILIYSSLVYPELSFLIHLLQVVLFDFFFDLLFEFLMHLNISWSKTPCWMFLGTNSWVFMNAHKAVIRNNFLSFWLSYYKKRRETGKLRTLISCQSKNCEFTHSFKRVGLQSYL